MSRRFAIFSTAVVTTVLVSAFWIFAYNISVAPRPRVVDPATGGPIEIAKGIEVGPAGLALPVVGVKGGELADTFSQARAGGARVHDAIDIVAPEGTPVVAAADGTVEKLYFSEGGGGLSIYVRSPDKKWTYYYAHLQGYAPGLAEGQQVKRGQALGRVGHTGNANPEGPHLHFAINRMEPGDGWWQGSPVNPYPLLAGKKASG